MARPQPQPSLAKAPTKEHPLAPERAVLPTPATTPAVDASVMFSTRLNPDLRRQLKVYAAEHDQTIQEVTEAALRSYLQRRTAG